MSISLDRSSLATLDLLFTKNLTRNIKVNILSVTSFLAASFQSLMNCKWKVKLKTSNPDEEVSQKLSLERQVLQRTCFYHVACVSVCEYSIL